MDKNTVLEFKSRCSFNGKTFGELVEAPGFIYRTLEGLYNDYQRTGFWSEEKQEKYSVVMYAAFEAGMANVQRFTLEHAE